MKHLLILVILVLGVSSAIAQKPWKWTQLKGPNSSSHTSQLLLGANGEIISVGNAGYYSTTNDGASWEYHQIISKIHSTYQPYLYSGLLTSSSGDYYFYFGSSFDTTDLAVSGVYRSTDKGSTWKQMIHGRLIFGICEIGIDTLLISTQDNYEYSILESIDKGNSWTKVSSYGTPSPIAATNKYVFFKLDANEGYIDEISLNNNNYPNRIFNISNDTTGLIILSDNSILAFDNSKLIHSDGASYWDSTGKLNGIVSLIKGTDNILYSLFQSDQRNLNLASSSDQGKSWNTVGNVSPYRSGDKYSFFCPNSGTLLYGNDTALYLSRDKGSSWKEIGLPFDSINKIIVADDGKLFTEPVDRFDQYHYVYNYFDAQISSDKGESWYKSEPADHRIKGIGKSVNGTILAISPDANDSWNSIWLFDKSQKTEWQKRSSVENIYDHPLFATDGSKYTYLATNNYLTEPIIYRSDDNAFSWIDIEAPNTGNDISALDASSDGTLYFGTYPIMYRSDDHGTSWIKLEPVHDIVKLTSIKTFGTTSVLLGTEGDGLMLSNDKGNTWSRIDGNNFDTVTCVSITSRGEIAAGTNRGLWISDTSQHKWSRVILGKDSELHIGGIDVAKNDDFYVGTYGSSVWVGTRNYNPVKNISPEGSVMRLSPNPASDKITISLDLPSESSIKLEIFDALGKRVAIAADGKYSGDEQIILNSSALSNGIYTAVLSGDKNETQKFIIAR